MMMLAMVMVVLTTDLGKIELQLDQAHAPLTTANFVASSAPLPAPISLRTM